MAIGESAVTAEPRHPQPITPAVQKTIVTKLKKFFGGSNKPQTVATKIPEQGGSGGGSVEVHMVEGGRYVELDKTGQELLDLFRSGKEIYYIYEDGPDELYRFVMVYEGFVHGVYLFTFVNLTYGNGDPVIYMAENLSDYPHEDR